MSTEFDSFAETYQSDIDKYAHLLGKKHSFFVLDKVKRLLAEFGKIGQLRALKVLDIGCGIGLGHGPISNAVAELHGVDVSKKSLEIAAKNNSKVSYKAYKGDVLPYKDNSFDCVYAICVLHHIPRYQWSEFIMEMARVVRPGGQIVVIEHNPVNPATQWVVNTCELDKNANLLTSWRLRKLFVDAGIIAPRVIYTLFTPFEMKFFRILCVIFYYYCHYYYCYRINNQ
jgi:ubiquinone/menaquinone biosynthesis C-methylase UbiE